MPTGAADEDLKSIVGYEVMPFAEYEGICGTFLYYFKESPAFFAFRDENGNLRNIMWVSLQLRTAVRDYLLAEMTRYESDVVIFNASERIPEFYKLRSIDDFYSTLRTYHEGREVSVTPLTDDQVKDIEDPEAQFLYWDTYANITFADGTTEQVPVSEIDVKVNII